MSRSRASAKAAGRTFEKDIAECLAEHVDDRIERRRQSGAKDRGDLAAVRTHAGHRVVVECKNYGGQVEVGPWLNESEQERINDDAEVAVVVAKRKGIADPLQQIVLMSVADLIGLLNGERP